METEYHLVVLPDRNAFRLWTYDLIQGYITQGIPPHYHYSQQLGTLYIHTHDVDYHYKLFSYPYDTNTIRGYELNSIIDPNGLVEVLPEETQSILRILIRRVGV